MSKGPIASEIERLVSLRGANEVSDVAISLEEFLKLSAQGNLIPVYRQVPGDLETPVSAYYKLASRSAYSFLLESVEGEEKIAL